MVRCWLVEGVFYEFCVWLIVLRIEFVYGINKISFLMLKKLFFC